MIVLDSTIVNVALPSIKKDLGFSQTSLACVVNGYLLNFGGFLLLGGRLGDLYGHQRLAPDRADPVYARIARLRPCTGARISRRGARDSGLRRRDRLRGVAIADDVTVRRARAGAWFPLTIA